MRQAAAVVLALSAACSAVAQRLPVERAACLKPPIWVQQSCVDASTATRPGRLLSVCLQEVETALQQLDEHEACITEALNRRQADERRDLAAEMARRRAELLKNLHTTLR